MTKHGVVDALLYAYDSKKDITMAVILTLE
jgi:hypothetical protein